MRYPQRGLRFAAAALITTCGLALSGCHREDPTEPTAPEKPAPLHPVTAGKLIPSQPPTNDPKVVLARMVAVYNNLDSAHYESDSEVLSNFAAPSDLHQSTVLRYQRQPARMRLEASDPVSGTIRYFADGNSLVNYSAMRNSFTHRNGRGDLATIASTVDRLNPGLLYPVVFLKNRKGVPSIASVRIARTESLSGRLAYVLQGQFEPAYARTLSGLPPGREVTAKQADFTLWVDHSDYELLKSQARFYWVGSMPDANGRSHPVQRELVATETVTSFIPNPRIPQDEFRFVKPKDAKENFIESRGDT